MLNSYCSKMLPGFSFPGKITEFRGSNHRREQAENIERNKQVKRTPKVQTIQSRGIPLHLL